MTQQNITSHVKIPTVHASRYLQQLCKHWAHHLTVEFTPEKGKVVFPHDARGANWPGDAVLEMAARADGLECWLFASDPAQLAALEGAVARHLDRFAFREAPLVYDWQVAA